MGMTYEEDGFSLKTMLCQLDTVNWYNDKLQVVRVKISNRLYDIKLGSVVFEYPNPLYHYILVTLTENILRTEGFLSSDERYRFKPGMFDDTSIAKLSSAQAFLLDKNQKISTTRTRGTSASFAIEDSDLSDENKLRVSITPSSTRPYTNTDKEEYDPRSSNIGIFMNQDTIYIKSAGGAILIGKEGIHFGGNVHWEASKHSRDIMVDNPLAGFIPDTIVTPFTVAYLPNFANILNLAQTGQNILKVTEKINKVNNILEGI